MSGVGYNPLEQVVGGTGLDDNRITDPTTGAGLFTPNTDPNVVGIDPLTGLDAPVGTDMGFGAPIESRLVDGLYNGDLLSPPPYPDQPIMGDPSSADYNPIPYWRHVPAGNGAIVLTWDADGKVIGTVAATGGAAAPGAYLEQLVPVHPEGPAVVRYEAWACGSRSSSAQTAWVSAQFLKADGTTTGTEGKRGLNDSPSAVATPNSVGTAPADARWLRVRVGVEDGTAIGGSATITYVGVRRSVDAVVIGSSSQGIQGEYGRIYNRDGWLVLTPEVGVVVGGDGGGYSAPGGVVFGGFEYLSLGGNVNDWDTGAGVELVAVDNGGSNRTITGLVAPPLRLEGTQKVIYNISGTGNVVLSHADSASAVTNRILCPNNSNLTIRPRSGVILRYFGDSGPGARWRVISEV